MCVRACAAVQLRVQCGCVVFKGVIVILSSKVWWLGEWSCYRTWLSCTWSHREDGSLNGRSVILEFFPNALSHICAIQAAGMHLIQLLWIHISVCVVIDWHTSLRDVIHYNNSQTNHYYRKMAMYLPSSENNSFQCAALLMLINRINWGWLCV